MYIVSAKNNRVLVKNGNEYHIVMVNSYDNKFIYTSFKKYPIKNVCAGVAFSEYSIVKYLNFKFDPSLKVEDSFDDFIKFNLEKINLEYVLKTKRDHQIKFRTEVFVKINNNLIYDSVAKVDKEFVYFDTWKCKRSDIYCIVLPNGKRKFRFKFNTHVKCNYNVNDVPLI